MIVQARGSKIAIFVISYCKYTFFWRTLIETNLNCSRNNVIFPNFRIGFYINM